MELGYVVIKNAFPAEDAEEWTKDVWHRLGMDPNDKSTWTQERTNMPAHRREKVSVLAPKVWTMIDMSIIRVHITGEFVLGLGRYPRSSWGPRED